MIRKATYDDIPELMEVFSKAREIMRSSGNMNQWNDNYPSEDIVRNDISQGVCYVLCESKNSGRERILATMAFIPGPDPTYAEIYDGEWIDEGAYHVIHRIAARESGRGAAARLLEWAHTQADTIRIDTHKDNVIMHHIMQKQDFTHCGVIYLQNGNPREAYQYSRKVNKYKDLYTLAQSVIDGETDMTANMANLSAIIHRGFGFWWTGFYRVCPEQKLVLGPFQGPIACTRIGYGRGVCGTAWQRGETIVVSDVEQFPGHIACSSESRSEIVVPVWKEGKIIAVLDIDSEKLETFDGTDKVWLEKIVALL